jgi:hypothetical protein
MRGFGKSVSRGIHRLDLVPHLILGREDAVGFDVDPPSVGRRFAVNNALIARVEIHGYIRVRFTGCRSLRLRPENERHHGIVS